MRKTIEITDNAMSAAELLKWQGIVENHPNPPSFALHDGDEALVGSVLYQTAQELVGGLPLIHCLLFAINKDNDQTELHIDYGEYVVLFYPHSNPLGPLRTIQDGAEVLVDVVANRLVQLHCTNIWHQQVIPSDRSTRYSVAFKFRLPPDEYSLVPSAKPVGF